MLIIFVELFYLYTERRSCPYANCENQQKDDIASCPMKYHETCCPMKHHETFLAVKEIYLKLFKSSTFFH